MEFINIGERAYKYIRQFTIKTVMDALIELITNSIDAYNKCNIVNKNIWILVSPTKIIVRDNAKGLTSKELYDCFLQVGNYTAEDSSRGFFSRGAKDISAIGNITFDAIKDGLYSQCKLNSDAYGALLIEDIQATQEIRTLFGISGTNNGLSVTIDLLPNFHNTNFDNICHALIHSAQLRDIMSNKNNNIIISKIDNTISKRLLYTYPPGTLLLDLEYAVPNYTQYNARLVIYKTETAIEQPKKECEMEFGFLIKDSIAVYEVSTVDNKYRWNPYINYIYGFIYCDGIHELLLDYDKNGISPKNPYPIIDPSRLTGVNKQHPFIISLFSIATVRIDYILRQLNTTITSGMVAIDDLNELINELEKLGIDLVMQNDVKINFNPTYDQKLIQAISSDRANYVKYETSYLMDNKYTQKEETIFGNIKSQLDINCDGGNMTSGYIYTQDGNIVELPNFLDSTIQSSDPVNILSLIPPENETDVMVHPYIYTLTGEGKLERLYVFSKGGFDLTGDSNPITIPNKVFNIQFNHDINSITRYNVDYTNGVNIQINVNNQSVFQYLVNQPTNPLATQKSISKVREKLMNPNIKSRDGTTEPTKIILSNYTSTQSILFFKEIFTDIVTQMIIDNDAKNGGFSLDCSSCYDNLQRVACYRLRTLARIEQKIETVFRAYINRNIVDKIRKIQMNIDAIASSFVTQMDIAADILEINEKLSGAITMIKDLQTKTVGDLTTVSNNTNNIEIPPNTPPELMNMKKVIDNTVENILSKNPSEVMDGIDYYIDDIKKDINEQLSIRPIIDNMKQLFEELLKNIIE